MDLEMYIDSEMSLLASNSKCLCNQERRGETFRRALSMSPPYKVDEKASLHPLLSEGHNILVPALFSSTEIKLPCLATCRNTSASS